MTAIFAEQGLPAPQQDRDPANTQKYAEGCLKVAAEAGVPAINFHSALIEAAGGSDAEHLDPYL